MALPEGKNLNIYKGDSYGFDFRLRDRTLSGQPGPYVNLTGCAAKAQIRATEDSNSVLAEFTCAIPDQTVSANLGRVKLSLTPTQTAALTNGVWDVQITFLDGTVRTYLKGTVTAGKEVTRV